MSSRDKGALYVYGEGSTLAAWRFKYHVGSRATVVRNPTCMLNKRKLDGRAATFVRERSLSRMSRRFETSSKGCFVAGHCALFSHGTWLKWQVFGCPSPNSFVFQRTELLCSATHESDHLKKVTSIDRDGVERVFLSDGIGLAHVESTRRAAKRIAPSTKQIGWTASRAWFLTNKRDRHPDAWPPAMLSSSLQTRNQG